MKDAVVSQEVSAVLGTTLALSPPGTHYGSLLK